MFRGRFISYSKLYTHGKLDFCLDTNRRCGFFLEVFGLTLPNHLDCELLPENSNPDDCVGHQEVLEANRKAETPGEWIAVTILQLAFLRNRSAILFAIFYKHVALCCKNSFVSNQEVRKSECSGMKETMSRTFREHEISQERAIGPNWARLFVRRSRALCHSRSRS